jgi:Protein of unknown function (DUF5672)
VDTLLGVARFLPQLLKHIRSLNNVQRHINRQYFRKKSNEDMLWSQEALKYHRTFTIPSVDLALNFAFEAAPQLCYELNYQKLPFSCHVWKHYDRTFWESYLLS